MKRRFVFAVFAAFLLTALSGLTASAQSSYTFTDLGVVNPSVQYSTGLGINNAGQILGQTKTNASTTRVFKITPVIDANGRQSWFKDSNNDGINDLMALPSLPAGFTFNYASAGAINASGQAACVALAARGTVPQDAIVWSANGIPTILTSTSVTSSGSGINDGGDVVGNYYDYKHNKPSYPYLWQYTNGIYTATQLSTSSGSAYTVNNLRQVLGENGSAFLWLPSATYGLSQGIHTLNGISVGSGKNLNNSGIISGTFTSNSHLCLWAPPGGGAAYGLNDGNNDLGSGSFVSIYPHGLNNPTAGQALQVVGFAKDASNNSFAFIWDSANKTALNLNTVTVNLPTGWTLQAANGINDLGQIVGSGTYNGVTRAFVLTPQ